MPAKSHGMTGTRIHNMWKNMKGRCSRPSSTHWERYGGRGIRVEEPWFSSFESFMEWAISNGYKDDLTIDRIDEDGNYCPSNCQFISSSENVSKANKKHLLNKTGGQSKESHEKTKEINRQNMGFRCRLINASGDLVGEFISIGHAAEYLSSIVGREFKSIYSHLKQIVNGRCKTLAGYTLEVI